jgi:hypothetical protein
VRPARATGWVSKADAADRVNQLHIEAVIDLPSQPRHGHIDDVVQWRGPRGDVSHITREHLSRDHPAHMTEEILQHLELFERQLERPAASHDLSRHEIHHQIVLL